jgi:ribonuclease R
VQAIYRVHPAPGDDDLDALVRLMRVYAEHHRLNAADWVWSRETESLADYVERLPADGPYWRHGRALTRQVIMAGHGSRFSAKDDGHYGVGASVYGRFSAPMREIVGILTHKELAEALGWQEAGPRDQDLAVQKEAIRAGNRAKDIQRRVNKAVHALALNRLFRAENRKPEATRTLYPATVMGMRGNKLYAQLDSPPIEVKVYLDTLGGSPTVSADGAFLMRADGGVVWALGDAAVLRVASFDATRKQWVFRMTREMLDG